MFISKSFFVSRAFVGFGAKRSSSGAFGFDDVLEIFLKIPLHHIFCELRLRPWVFFVKIAFLSSKQSRCYLPDSHGHPQTEQSTLVMVRRKLKWQQDFRALARWSAGGPSIVVTIGTSRMRWSMVQKGHRHNEVSVWLGEVSTLDRLQNQRALRSQFPRSDVATVSHFAVFVYADV